MPEPTADGYVNVSSGSVPLQYIPVVTIYRGGNRGICRWIKLWHMYM